MRSMVALANRVAEERECGVGRRDAEAKRDTLDDGDVRDETAVGGKRVRSNVGVRVAERWDGGPTRDDRG